MNPGRRSATLENSLREQVAKAHLRLPVLPEVAVSVRTAVADPSSNALTLSQIIERDPALAARLLRLSNCAMYAGLHEIRTLHQAIARLGSCMVVAIVLGAATKDTFRSTDPELRALLARAWQRSMVSALLGRRLAGAVGLDRDEAFLMGLIHAVGEPALVDVALRLLLDGRIRRSDLAELPALLRAHRAAVGGELLRSWKMPAAATAAVEFQDAPERAPAEFRPAARLVGFAAALAAHLVSDETADRPFAHADRGRFGLDDNALAALITAIRDDHDEVSGLF